LTFVGRRSGTIALQKAQRVNEEINAPEVRLIGADGEQLGVVSVRAALALAEEAGLDLVEIAPMAQPPVCRIVDFGKFKYQEQKRQHEQKLKQKQVQVKEVKLRPGTDENDYQIKLRNMTRFLEEEDKVKVTLRFRGREMAHQDIGMRQIERIRADLQDLALVEQMPKMEGRQMVMVLTPSKKRQIAGATAGDASLVPCMKEVVPGSKSFRRETPGSMSLSGAFNAQDENQDRSEEALQDQSERSHQAFVRLQATYPDEEGYQDQAPVARHDRGARLRQGGRACHDALRLRR